MKTFGLVTRSAGIAAAMLCALPLAATAADMSTTSGSAAPPAAHAMKPAAKSASMAMKPAKKTAHAMNTAHRQLVMKVQEALNMHGAKLKADGVDGPKTRHALMNYQAANGLAKTGKIDAATKKSLGIG